MQLGKEYSREKPLPVPPDVNVKLTPSQTSSPGALPPSPRLVRSCKAFWWKLCDPYSGWLRCLCLHATAVLLFSFHSFHLQCTQGLRHLQKLNESPDGVLEGRAEISAARG